MRFALSIQTSGPGNESQEGFWLDDGRVPQPSV